MVALWAFLEGKGRGRLARPADEAIHSLVGQMMSPKALGEADGWLLGSHTDFGDFGVVDEWTMSTDIGGGDEKDGFGYGGKGIVRLAGI
jgi:hypothetical protein